MFKGVFFDLGGTLYSYKKFNEMRISLMKKLARRLNIEAEAHEILRYYQSACKDADKQYAEQSFYLFRDYIEAIFLNFVNRFGSEHSQDDFYWFEEQQRITIIDGFELKHDCHNTLSALKSRNLYLSVVSNSDENQLQPLIEKVGLQRWIDHWTSSESAQSCKPDSRIFEIALEKSGLSPNEVIFVGDSLEQDVQGAHNVGMVTVLVCEDGVETPMHIGKKNVEPDYRITELNMLVDIIDNH